MRKVLLFLLAQFVVLVHEAKVFNDLLQRRCRSLLRRWHGSAIKLNGWFADRDGSA
jgi:hypothetical protein